jgi:hypothetical protein
LKNKNVLEIKTGEKKNPCLRSVTSLTQLLNGKGGIPPRQGLWSLRWQATLFIKAVQKYKKIK